MRNGSVGHRDLLRAQYTLARGKDNIVPAVNCSCHYVFTATGRRRVTKFPYAKKSNRNRANRWLILELIPSGSFVGPWSSFSREREQGNWRSLRERATCIRWPSSITEIEISRRRRKIYSTRFEQQISPAKLETWLPFFQRIIITIENL